MIVFVVCAKSESSDEADPIVFDHDPTETELKAHISDLDGTVGDVDFGGPGKFGSYWYLTVTQTEVIE